MNSPTTIKITVATVTYNAAPLLERTLRSVAEQDYPNVEHLIVDGNSNDGTLALLEQYKNSNAATTKHEFNMVSEPDSGLYDAMNKAILMATGDFILFLNAGDCFHAKNTLSLVAETANQFITEKAKDLTETPAVIYGDTHIVDENGNFVRKRRLTPPKRLTWKSFKNGMVVCHQAFFARTDIARMTLYDLQYRCSADFDWCIRIMRYASKQRLALINANAVIANFMEGGLSTQRHRQSLFERFSIMRKHYGLLQTLMLHAYFVVRTVFKK